MDIIKLGRVCSKCSGDGVFSEFVLGDIVEEDPCKRCGGSGYQTSFEVLLPDKCFFSSDVFQCVVLSELVELNAIDLEKVKIVLSLGIIDLNTGSKERVLLMSVFDSETQTYDNLNGLVNG